jgi:hypothetical protein
MAMRQHVHEVPDVVRLAHCGSIEFVLVEKLSHDLAEPNLAAHKNRIGILYGRRG